MATYPKEPGATETLRALIAAIVEAKPGADVPLEALVAPTALRVWADICGEPRQRLALQRMLLRYRGITDRVYPEAAGQLRIFMFEAHPEDAGPVLIDRAQLRRGAWARLLYLDEATAWRVLGIEFPDDRKAGQG